MNISVQPHKVGSTGVIIFSYVLGVLLHTVIQSWDIISNVLVRFNYYSLSLSLSLSLSHYPLPPDEL